MILRIIVLLCLVFAEGIWAQSGHLNFDIPDDSEQPLNPPISELVITPVEYAPAYLALPKFILVGPERDTHGLASLLWKQLERDLQLSGYFDLLPPSTYGIVDLKRDGLTSNTIDFSTWSMIGAQFLIKARLFITAQNKGKVEFMLFDVTTGVRIAIPHSSYEISRHHYRFAAHDFTNRLIAYMSSGKKGPFGTLILFSKMGKGNRRNIGSIAFGNANIGQYDLPSKINVLPSWGPQGSFYYSTFGPQGSQLQQFFPKDRNIAILSQRRGLNMGADYCPSKDLLALTLSFEGNAEIYTMKPDGTELQRLTQDPSNDVSPTWAPGCRQLAFVSNREGNPQIYIMHADGSHVRRLTYVGNYNTAPEWSPAIKENNQWGSWIAFTARDEFNHFDVFVIRPDGSEIYRITQDQGDNEEPSWSPDGRYLVFQSTRDGRKPKLFVTRIDTRGAFQRVLSQVVGLKTPVWQP